MGPQQIVILSDEEAESNGSMQPIGPRADVIENLSHWNTGPAVPEGDILYGPGFSIELSPGQDPITQMLLTIDDQDIAWTVIMRLARKFGWKLLDPMSGRELRSR